MIIGKYIRQLLDDRKRVVLPGFGNLEVKETSGMGSGAGSKVDPPGLTVKFDTGFSKDDGLLASVLAAGEELSGDEAGQRVLELIDAIKFALDRGDSYILPETGTIVRDHDGKIHFQVDQDWLLEPAQYGLESIDLLELEELPIEEVNAPEKEEPAVVSSGSIEKKPVVKTRRQTLKPRPVEKKSRHIKRWRVIWIVGGLLIVILIALIFIPSDLNRNKIPGNRETQPPMEVIEQIPENQVEQTPVVSEPEPRISEPETVKEIHNFYIIAGSFKHLKNASDAQDKLIARGFSAEVLVTENRMYRVSVASYATEQEAEQKLAGIKDEPGLGSCWLLSN